MGGPWVRSSTALGSSLGIQSESGTQFLACSLLVRVLRLSNKWQKCRGVVLVIVLVVSETRAMHRGFAKSFEARSASGVFFVGL